MKRPGRRAALAAGAAALIGAAGAFAPLMAAADAPNPRSAADCRAITDFQLRGQCWDELDKAVQKDTQVTKKRFFGLGANAEDQPKKERVAKTKTPKPEDDGVHSLILTIADVQNNDSGGLLWTATDGAVWEQTDGDVVNGEGPRPGDTFKVSKGFLGGFMCEVSRWQTVRCQRDK